MVIGMSDKYISTSIQRMRKRLKQADDKEEARQEQIQETVDILLAKFEAEAKSKKIKDFDMASFTNLVKLQLLLSDKPTEIIENRDDIEAIENIEEIADSEAFADIVNQLYTSLNEQNEKNSK